MKKQNFGLISGIAVIFVCLLCAGCLQQAGTEAANPGSSNAQPDTTVTITDGFGRTVTVPANPTEVVCSGSGCLRYLVYLQGQDLVVGVDDIEKKDQAIEGRPYTLVYGQQFKSLPLIGEFRGNDDPEKIVGIGPEIIFKTGSTGTAVLDKRCGRRQAPGEDRHRRGGVPVRRAPGR